MHDAAKLLGILFNDDDIVNIVATDGKYGWDGEAVTVADARQPSFMAALMAENESGKSIYFCVNPLKSKTPPEGATSSRKISNIRTIKNVMLDIDEDADKWFPIVQEKTPPGYIQQTSNGKFQKIWRIRDCDTKQFGQITDAFAAKLGGDPKCGDICRLFRLPGFKNFKKKYAPDFPTVTASMWVNRVVTPADFSALVEEHEKDLGMKAIADGKITPGEPKNEGLLTLKIDAGLAPIESRIGAVTLGQNFECPFHDPGEANSNRSFGFIMSDEGYIIYRCHHAGCDAKGDVIDFVQQRDGIDVASAISKLKRETYANEMEAAQAAEQGKLRNLPVTALPSLALSEGADIPDFPVDALEGDLIGDLTRLLTDGTFIPPQFVRQSLKVGLGHAVDGLIGFPGQPRLHMRRYNFLVGPPESGKGESWNRSCARDLGAADGVLAQEAVNRVDGAGFGSGQFLAGYLAKNPNTIIYFDEGRQLFEQNEMKGSTLETVFLSLFESNSIAQGSFKNGATAADNVHLSVSGGFTEDSFTAAFGGRGSRGSGFLSRCELAFGQRIDIGGRDWPLLNVDAISAICEKLTARILSLGPRVGGHHARIPAETDAARRLREEFQKWLQGQSRDHVSRLLSHFKRDLALRALFAREDGDVTITEDAVRRSIFWAQNQLELRRRLWPDDRGGPVEVFERRILVALATGPKADRDLIKLCHVNREGSGGREVYGRAIKSLFYGSHEIEVVGQTRKKRPVYALAVETDES